ncbi:unnamed protein product, partial [Ectocarpus sp. 4 AP-2014]
MHFYEVEECERGCDVSCKRKKEGACTFMKRRVERGYVSCKRKQKENTHSHDYEKGLFVAGGVETVCRSLSRSLTHQHHAQSGFLHDSRLARSINQTRGFRTCTYSRRKHMQPKLGLTGPVVSYSCWSSKKKG